MGNRQAMLITVTQWPPSDTGTLPPDFMAEDPSYDEYAPTRLGLIVSSILFLCAVAFWVWAFSPWAPRGHPDELDSMAFPEAAEPICAATMEAVAETPVALTAASFDDRAEQIEANTALLQAMVQELRSVAPDPATSDGDIIGQWLDDWDLYISDRQDYSNEFRQGNDLPFTVSTTKGDHVTQLVDRFTEINGFESCSTPLDV